MQRVGYSWRGRSRGQGWSPRARRGVGLQAGAARPGDTLLLDPCKCCSGREGAKPTPFPPSPPWAALTFIRRRGEPSQLCLLLPVERSPGKPQRNSGSRGSIPPPLPSPSRHGTPQWDAAPDLGPFRASSAARSVPVPTLPGRGAAAPSALVAAAEPPPRSPPKLLPASNESPAHGRASPQHIFFFFFFLPWLPSGPRCEPASSQAPQQTRLPAEPGRHLTSLPRGRQALAHALAPPKVHRDGLATPKPCPGCKEVWQLCSIPAHWGRGCWSAPGMAGHLCMETQGLLRKQPYVASCWSPAPNWERV